MTSCVSGTVTSTLRFKFRFRIQLTLSARENKRAKTEGGNIHVTVMSLFILKRIILDPRDYIFLICCRALAWTLLYKIHRVGMLLEKWKSSEGM